jgi:iron complex transport system permease protein
MHPMNEKTDRTLKALPTPARVLRICVILFIGLILTAGFSLKVGTAPISWHQVYELFTGQLAPGEAAQLVLYRIRLPRIILAGIVGFALSLGGVTFQALLRNPLADPFILGVSSGSAFGAVAAILLNLGFQVGVPVMSFAGGLLTLFLLLVLGHRKMGMESSTILLTGVIINAFFTAIIMFFISTSSDSRLHTMLFWLYGDLSQSRYGQLALIIPVVLGAGCVLYVFSRDLNLMTAGEETARQMGVPVDRTKMICLVTVSLIIGLVVAFSGLIGFIGLIVPHLARMMFGSDHRILLPAAALGGAMFLIAADTLARVLISPNELPVGVITAFMGAPFFIYLLRSRGNHWSRS